MTDKNTVTPKAFIVMNIVGVLLIFVAFPIFFHQEIGLWNAVSLILLSACGCLLSFSKRRNRLSVWIDLLLPIELIALFSRDSQSKRLIPVLSVIFVFLAFGYAALVIRSGWKRRGYFRVTRIQLRWIVCGVRTIFAVIMSVLLLPLAVNYRAPSIPTQVSVNELSCSTESCEASLSRIAAPKYKTLTREDKLNVLRDVCRVEFTELGIKHGFSLECGELDDENLAQYNESNYTITINSKYIDNHSPFSLVRTMCHECFHARQFELLDDCDSFGQYTEEELEEIQTVYRRELDNYCSPREDSERYRAQKIERDANTYAAQACLKYLRFCACPAEEYADSR